MTKIGIGRLAPCAPAGETQFSPEATALLTLVEAVRSAGYRHVTVTPATHARVDARPENRWARSAADIFGWSRPFTRGILPASWFNRMAAAGLLMPVEGGWRSRIRLSTLGGEIFIHSAFPTSEENSVFFGPDTYRFCRAIETHLAGCGPLRRALDIGCGAGAGGILIARSAPDAEVLLADINDAALRMARLNVCLAGLSNARAIYSDLFEEVDGHFDLIVANPPYLVDPARRSYRDGGGDLGAALSLAIAQAAPGRLAPGGTLLLYTASAIVAGEDPLHTKLAAMLEGSGMSLRYHELDPDIFGEELDAEPYRRADRIAAILLTITQSR